MKRESRVSSSLPPFPEFPKPVPEASLNRATVPYPDSDSTWTGAELLSRQAIAQLCEKHGSSINALFDSTESVKPGLLEEWADRLTAFIHALRTARYFRNHANPEVQAMGRRWGEVSAVLCGGGLLAHPAAGGLVDRANDNLSGTVTLRLADSPREIVLQGLAAREATLGTFDPLEPGTCAVLLDFGHGAMKALAVLPDARFIRLPTHAMDFSRSVRTDDTSLPAETVYAEMKQATAVAFEACSNMGARPKRLLVSLVAYMHHCVLLPNHVGAYARLSAIDPDMRKLLTRMLADLHGTSRPETPYIEAYHDGQAAALGCRHEDAVLVFGEYQDMLNRPTVLNVIALASWRSPAAEVVSLRYPW